MPRFLVTGCAGFIGSTLSERLLADGSEVVGIDAFTDYYERELKERNLSGPKGRPKFEFIEHDLGTGVPGDALYGLDGIFHLAARPGVRASWGVGFRGYANDNMLATQAIAEAAAERNIRLVFASSSSIYGDALAYPTDEDVSPAPISPYGVTKLACEHLIRAYAKNVDLDFVSLRYFTVYGPRQRPDMAFTRIVNAVLSGERFTVFGDGNQSRDFTFVEDAVAATRAVMEKAPSGAAYNVGGGSEATVRDVIGIVQELSGRSLDVTYTDPAAGDVRRTLADTTRIRSDVGWQPGFNLRAGLSAQLEAAQAVTESG